MRVFSKSNRTRRSEIRLQELYRAAQGVDPYSMSYVKWQGRRSATSKEGEGQEEVKTFSRPRICRVHRRLSLKKVHLGRSHQLPTSCREPNGGSSEGAISGMVGGEGRIAVAPKPIAPQAAWRSEVQLFFLSSCACLGWRLDTSRTVLACQRHPWPSSNPNNLTASMCAPIDTFWPSLAGFGLTSMLLFQKFMQRTDVELIQELDVSFSELANIRRAVCKAVMPAPQTVRSKQASVASSSQIHSTSANSTFAESYNRSLRERLANPNFARTFPSSIASFWVESPLTASLRS